MLFRELKQIIPKIEQRGNEYWAPAGMGLWYVIKNDTGEQWDTYICTHSGKVIYVTEGYPYAYIVDKYKRALKDLIKDNYSYIRRCFKVPEITWISYEGNPENKVVPFKGKAFDCAVQYFLERQDIIGCKDNYINLRPIKGGDDPSIVKEILADSRYDGEYIKNNDYEELKVWDKTDERYTVYLSQKGGKYGWDKKIIINGKEAIWNTCRSHSLVQNVFFAIAIIKTVKKLNNKKTCKRLKEIRNNYIKASKTKDAAKMLAKERGLMGDITIKNNKLIYSDGVGKIIFNSLKVKDVKKQLNELVNEYSLLRNSPLKMSITKRRLLWRAHVLS